MFKVAAALLLKLAVLRLIGLVVSVVKVIVFGVAHAEPSSLWVLLANIQAIKVLTFVGFILLSVVNLPTYRGLKWLIECQLSIRWLSIEWGMMTSVGITVKLLSLGLVGVSLKLLLTSVLVSASVVAVKTCLL